MTVDYPRLIDSKIGHHEAEEIHQSTNYVLRKSQVHCIWRKGLILKIFFVGKFSAP